MGNKAFTKTVELLFGKSFADMLSGYRVFSRRFVKSFPLISSGFEIETEMTIHALALAVPSKEIPTAYDERPKGSVSKLSTYKDGFKILLSIIALLKNERPLFLSALSPCFRPARLLVSGARSSKTSFGPA